MLFNYGRATHLMQRDRVDALVATSIENTIYLTGHDNPTHQINRGVHIMGLFSPGHEPEASSIIPALEVETFLRSESWVKDVYLVGLFARTPGDGGAMDAMGEATAALVAASRPAPSAIAGLVDALTRRGLARARIAVDEFGLPATGWQALQAALPDAEILPASSLFWEIRMVKTAEEIRRLREASRITEIAVAEAIRQIVPGMRDADLQRIFRSTIVAHDGQPTFAMFGSGSLTAQPHLLTADKVIEPGDLLRWDVGCSYAHYHSDTARAVTLGEPTTRQRHNWAALSDGVRAALSMIRAGADPAALFDAAMAPGHAAGLKNHARFHCGHGIGITVYDPPIVTCMDPTQSVFMMPRPEGGLEAGMVINIEVGHYIQGEEGYLCEDTVLVTESGCERLTSASYELERDRFLAGAAVP